MVRCSLNGQWLMRNETASDNVPGTVPGSVYSFLLNAGRMEDPYYRDRELDALKRMEDDYTFSRTFTIQGGQGTKNTTGGAACCGTDSAEAVAACCGTGSTSAVTACCGTDSAAANDICCSADCCTDGNGILTCTHQILRFDGIDTLSEVRLNGVVLGRTDNMHITWEFDVRGILRSGENVLEVTIFSPTRFIREADRKYHLGGSDEAMRGFPHLRKAHCMFGWDWGPRLPDGGIWRDVWLEGWNESRIEEIRIRQVHLIRERSCGASDAMTGETCAATGAQSAAPGEMCAETGERSVAAGEAYAMSGEVRPASGASDHAQAAREGRVCVDLTVDVVQSGSLPVSIRVTGPDGFTADLENGKPLRIENPKLWWPNGLGAQPLYEVSACLISPTVLPEEACASPASESFAASPAGDCTSPAPESTAASPAEGCTRPASESTAASPTPASAGSALCDLGNTSSRSVPAPAGKASCSIADSQTRRIGLRTLTMRRDKDEWGESFAMEANGQCVFSMGADYIPEDNILSRMNRERTRELLENCRLAHFNVIRVWGGGFYPSDWFFDLCDEMGLVVWQDMMFACANYRLTDEFVSSIRTEITQNVRRIRHHPSLGLWCGNNEMEQFAVERAYDGNDLTAADYLIQNEFIIPEIVKREDPGAFYWPSSPSSGGRFDLPSDPNRGDIHFWAVWHAGVPFTEYRKYYFRYMSEFGFQSFPCMETVRSFTEEEDRNIFSYVMEMHQRNSGANGKILQYLSATYRYPTSFETLLYASQLLQADAIRYGVEHLRRNRDKNRCMGAVYWQLNDIWPVASWASIDWYNRWKALHYAAVRFFAPVLLSCEENSMVSRGETCITEPRVRTGAAEPSGETCSAERSVNTCDARLYTDGVWESSARLNVSNETWDRVKGEVIWELRTPDSSILERGTFAADVAPFSTQWFEELDFSAYDPRIAHLTYRMHGSRTGGQNQIGSVLFTAPKHYRFADPQLTVCQGPGEGEITVSSKAYARYVEIYSADGYIRTDDNFFDMEAGTRTVRLLEGSIKNLRVRSVYDIQ